MIRAVPDANVVASGVLGIDREQSTPGAILRLWERRAFELITSDPLIAEVERTLTNAYFALLRQDTTVITITVAVSGVATHPEDDLVLAAAVSAAADYLVTGDRPLQPLGSYGGMIILSPREFLNLLEHGGY